MRLKSTRSSSEINIILMSPGSKGPDPVYKVFTDIHKKKWLNKTVINPGLFDKEFPKTYGHYHTVNVNEAYKLIRGKGLLLMQKKYFEDGRLVPDKVGEVVVIKVKKGEEIVVTPEWGHSWSNIGKTKLVTYDTWEGGFESHDYDSITNMEGLAYYVTKEGKNIKLTPNNNYRDLPKPKWLAAKDLL